MYIYNIYIIYIYIKTVVKIQLSNFNVDDPLRMQTWFTSMINYINSYKTDDYVYIFYGCHRYKKKKITKRKN